MAAKLKILIVKTNNTIDYFFYTKNILHDEKFFYFVRKLDGTLMVMRFYFIRFTWIAFILLGLYLILDDFNDSFQTAIYALWILVGILYYLFSKDNFRHFWLSVLVALATVGIIIYYFYFKNWMI